MKKSINLNGIKTKVEFTFSEVLNTEKLGKDVRYKYYEGKTRVNETVNSLTKSEVIYTINNVDYKVYYVNTNKTNRSGFLVSGSKLEYNGKKFNNDKNLIEFILS